MKTVIHIVIICWFELCDIRKPIIIQTGYKIYDDKGGDLQQGIESEKITKQHGFLFL